MSSDNALVTLQRIRTQKVDICAREVTRNRQQLAKLSDQLDRLVRYQTEYRQSANIGTLQVLQAYHDRQLFLNRLDENIQALYKNLAGLKQQEEIATNALRAAIETTEALNAVIDLTSIRKLEDKSAMDQSLCDEQGRNAQANSWNRDLFE